MDIKINGRKYTLIRTCYACPEQYDVTREGKLVGYLRLRHGSFRADCPDCLVETVLLSNTVKGDGIFEDDERTEWLAKAILAIDTHLQQNPDVFAKAGLYNPSEDL